MNLTYDDWIQELENALIAHIDNYVTTDIEIRMEAPLPRAFTKPVITIAQFDGDRRNTGGMNTVGKNTVGEQEQGYWEMPSYLITVNTDNSSAYDLNGKRGRNKVSAELLAEAFGIHKHELAISTGGALKANLRPLGPVLGGGPVADRTIYQSVFILDIELIVPFISVVL